MQYHAFCGRISLHEHQNLECHHDPKVTLAPDDPGMLILTDIPEMSYDGYHVHIGTMNVPIGSPGSVHLVTKRDGSCTLEGEFAHDWCGWSCDGMGSVRLC